MKSNLGIWGGLSVLFFAIIFFVYSLEYPYSDELGPGPGFLPVWLSGLLIILSLIYIYEAYRGKDSAESMPAREAQKTMAFILMTMILYVVFLPLIGFNLTSTMFLFALLYKAYNWYTSLAISIVTSTFLFLLFAKFLDVQLPVNALGF